MSFGLLSKILIVGGGVYTAFMMCFLILQILCIPPLFLSYTTTKMKMHLCIEKQKATNWDSERGKKLSVDFVKVKHTVS